MYKSSKDITLFLFLIFVDQLSKYIIRHSGGFYYVCNKNIAFGIVMPVFLFWLFWLFITGLLLIILYRSYFIQNTEHQGRQNILYIMLILAGAISNIIDRLYFGCVIDFIDLKFWPVFNLADVYITVGAIMILAKTLKSKH